MDQNDNSESKLSAVEGIKAQSRQLRGRLLEGIADPSATFFDGDEQLIKFHGLYQGYGRDSATERKQAGLDKEYEFMARVRAPGGRLSAEQYLVLDQLAETYGHGSLRLTTRQGVQFHGLAKHDLPAVLGPINHALMTTFAACGDVVRNVTSTPAPIADAVHRRLDADSKLLSEELLPRTGAYHEIWVDGVQVNAPEPVEEPVYGPTYLPRKFKIGIATAEDNSIDVLTNDLGFVALYERGELIGYNVAVGGGFGMTHNKPTTYPRIASFVAFVGPDELLEAAKAVIALQRDNGDRGNRKHARLKYVVDELGLPWIKRDLERRMGHPLEDPRPMPRFQIVDHLGWHEQGDGNWYLGVPVPSGRIVDTDAVKYRAAFREVARQFKTRLIVTAQQDMLLADIKPADKAGIEALLRSHGLVMATDLKPVERWAIACVALPSCGLALTEAERVREPLVAQVESAMAAHGLEQERISVRITGCPNGCARPYAGDIGLVGRVPGFYAIYVGGDFEGTRLNEKLLERVAMEKIGVTLEPLFGDFAKHRTQGEGFGDYCHRVGLAHLEALIAKAAPALASA
jgi:sulfite reductase (ferredoxin)